MIPASSARLTFRSWTDEDTEVAEALWCDPEVTRYFGGALTREQPRDWLDTERKCAAINERKIVLDGFHKFTTIWLWIDWEQPLQLCPIRRVGR